MPLAVYERRAPQRTLLYKIVQDNLLTFLQRSRESRGLPRYVEQAFRRYLDCGILQKGFARVRCSQCGYETLVPFSSKERGVCPSCAGRRMAQTALRLVERVLPRVAVRQWVLSVPKQVRYHLARKGRLRRQVLDLFLRLVTKGIKARAGVGPSAPLRGPRAHRGASKSQGGAVTVAQRFGSSLNLNLHLHSLVLDGVYQDAPMGPQFREAAPPGADELKSLIRELREKILKLLKKHGCRVSLDDPDEDDEEPGLFETLQAASIQGMIGMNPEPTRVRSLGRDDEPQPPPERPCSAELDGFSIHAGVRIDGKDRQGLKHLCGYVLRPPFAVGRLALTGQGEVIFELRRKRWDGATHLLMTPLEFMEKLAALIPKPREHEVYYHGVLAPHAAMRSRVVPAEKGGGGRKRGCEESREDRIDWAALLQKTFGEDIVKCPRCSGRLEVIACITDPEVIRKIPVSMNQWSVPPALAPPRERRLALEEGGESGDDRQVE